MASQEMRVVAMRGDLLLLDGAAQSGCGSCHSRSHCGSGGGTALEVRVDPAQLGPVRVGDRVQVELADGAVLGLLMRAYLPPLLGLLAGLLGGSALGPDWAGLLLGAPGLGLGVLASRFASRRAAALQHQITRLPAMPGQGGCAH